MPDLAVRILVVDDDDAKRYVVCRMLRAAGYAIEEAATGHETLERVKAEQPDLIVLDVKLPDIDGMQVARMLKGDSATRSALVLQLSATFRDPQSRSMGLDAGADAYLTHPVDSEELLATVRALLRIARTERALREANDRANEALRRAQQGDERLRVMLEATRLGTWELLPATRELHWDAQMREMHGMRADEEVTFESVSRFTHPDDRERVIAAVERAVTGQDGGALAQDYRILVNGQVRWLEARGRCFFDEHGKATRFIGSAQRIDERKEREEQMQRWAEFQQYMLGVVGHDLRNPLTAIITSASTQLRRVEDETLRKSFTRIIHSGQRASRIVAGLLDYTRARLGKGIPVERRPTDLAKILRYVIDEAIAAAPERPIAIDIPPEVPGDFDADRLDQVFMNLVTNAIQYGPATEPISISVDVMPTTAIVRVHNGGPPIPAELQPNIFEPFRRATDEGRGLGLGLYIVKQIVTAHGGTVTLSSHAGRGTTFTVTLPLTDVAR